MAQKQKGSDAQGGGSYAWESGQPAEGQKGETQSADSLEKSFPLPDFLKNISPALAARQALWALSVLGSIGGIALALLGTIAVWIALGAMHQALVLPLSDAVHGMAGISAMVDPALSGFDTLQNATAEISFSLRNISSATAGAGAGIRALSSLPLVGSGLGFERSAAELESASKSMALAADGMDAMGAPIAKEKEGMAALKEDIAAIRSRLQSSQAGITSAFGFLQIGAAAIGLAMCALFSSTLSLALGIGLPKK